MISGLIFSSAALMFFLYMSIYRKSALFSFVVFLLCISVAALYFQVGWEGSTIVTLTCMIIGGYSLVQMTKQKVF